jgi:cell division septation protein DedD
VKLRTWIVAVALLLLQACATQDGASTAGSSAQAGTATEQVAYTPQVGLSPRERFREVLYLLEEGEPLAARAELLVYLENQPRSEVGRDLLRQIDTPSREYFPDESRPVELRDGESLSTLSQQYLGSLYQFYALARYNGIDEPRKITIGQTIEIPLTDKARQAFAQPQDQPVVQPEPELEPVPSSTPIAAEPEPEPAPAPEPIAVEPEPAPEPEVEPDTTEQDLAEADRLYREALNAYRAQDLERAIALWDEVLELQPGHENARLYRAQAMELKAKLSNLH